MTRDQARSDAIVALLTAIREVAWISVKHGGKGTSLTQPIAVHISETRGEQGKSGGAGMDRLLLRFKGSPSAYSNAVSAVEELNGVSVVDRAPKMLLVEATPTAAEELSTLSEWGISPEAFTPVPDTRKRIGRRVK